MAGFLTLVNCYIIILQSYNRMQMNADYILYIHGRPVGIIEAKKAGTTLTGVEVQSAKYRQGIADIFPAWHRPFSIHR
jgi:type I site-specific restriction endonuclease